MIDQNSGKALIQPVVTANPDRTGVFRPGAGFYLKMDNGSTWNPSTDRCLAWDNAGGDRPIAGDWNADGQTETGVYRPGPGSISRWTIPAPGILRPIATSLGTMPPGTSRLPETGMLTAGPRPAFTGLVQDSISRWTMAPPGIPRPIATSPGTMQPVTCPVAGDWNADGRTETGVYRPGAGFYLKMDSTGTWNPSTDRFLAWDNARGDLPVAGDWNADGRIETGVYRPGPGSISRWILPAPGTRRPIAILAGIMRTEICRLPVIFNVTLSFSFFFVGIDTINDKHDLRITLLT